jgi:putative ABC transport system substrate-binding protein
MLGYHHTQNTKTPVKYSYLLLFLLLIGLLVTACGGGAQAQETYTIGVVNYDPALDPIFAGFKAGMADLGYVEGKNVTYIYKGVLQADPNVIDAEIQRLLDQKVDLFLTMGTLPTLRAKQAVEGTNIPVVFAPVADPLKEGVVTNLRHPGGAITGIRVEHSFPKAMEWLLKLGPETKKVYVPYNPKINVSVTSVASLREVATTLGIELLVDEVDSSAEVMAAIEALPEEVRAAFLVPTPGMEAGIPDIIQAATKRGIAVGSTISGYIETGGMVTYGPNFLLVGKQAARLVDQILQGTPPGDLPVETAKFSLGINLKTAAALGLDIPDAILRQADTVVR